MTTPKSSHKMLFVILKDDQTRPFLKKIKQLGCKGAFIAPVRGLISSELLHRLALDQEKKRLCILIEDVNLLDDVIPQLVETFQFHQPNHGIMFSICLNRLIQAQHDQGLKLTTEAQTFNLMTAIFRHERRKDVLGLLANNDLQDISIFTGQGALKSEQSYFLGIQHSPQKDFLFTLVPTDLQDKVLDSLDDMFHIKDSKGISVQSMNLLAFNSYRQFHIEKEINTSQYAILLMVIDIENFESAVKFFRDQEWHGGTAIKAFNTITDEIPTQLFKMNLNPEMKVIFTIHRADKIRDMFIKATEEKELFEGDKIKMFILEISDTHGFRSID